MNPPCIAIVGRPNVGKSTLFNRLTGARQSVVWKERGTTRDRVYATVTWNRATVRLVDTGGYELDGGDALLTQVRRQIARAVEEAAAVLFVCDARDGLTPRDEEIAAWLRRLGKRVLLAVNKADDLREASSLGEFFRLGFGAPIAVSATHGRGVSDVLDALVASVAGVRGEAAHAAPAVRLAIVGRPNVGKSTLLNQLVQDERAIVSDQPGTTRDVVDTLITWNETPLLLVDTAGLRRRAKLSHPVELFTRARTAAAIAQCDAALVLLDATAGVSNDDQRIVQMVLEEGKGCLILANKWDLVRGKTQEALVQEWRYLLSFAAFVPIRCVSAATGHGLPRVMDLALRVARRRTTRVQSAALNACLQEACRRHRPGVAGRTAVKFFYAAQLESVPPTFALFVNRPDSVTRNYLQYLEGALRRRFELDGVPMRLQLRGRNKP